MTPESLRHEQWEQLAVGRALDALEPADEAALTAHLPLCAQCRRLIEEMTEVAGELALAADPVPLPPAVWSGISAAIESSDRPPVPAQARHAAPAGPPGGRPEGRRGSSVAVPGQRRPRPVSRLPVAVRWGAALSAAALVVVAVLLGSQLYRDKAASERQLAAIRSCVGGTQCSVVTLHGPTANAIALVRGRDVRMVVLNVPGNDPKTSTYVLWQLGVNAGAEAIGTFNVTGSGLRVIPVRLVAAQPRTGTLAVTREPGTKAPAKPSSNPLMQGKLT